MKWQLLILSQPSRREFLRQLIEFIEPQIAALGLRRCESVEIITSQFDPKYDLGTNRQKLKEQSDAEYINFIDDDDLVAPDYIQKLLPLLDGVDQVGFQVECYQNQNGPQLAYHSLKYRNWYEDRNGRHGMPGILCRDLSHMTPMRRELSMRTPMEGGIGEDCRWANRIRDLAIVRTEHYLPEVMYYYLWRGTKTDHRDPFDPWRLAFLEKLKPVKTVV